MKDFIDITPVLRPFKSVGLYKLDSGLFIVGIFKSATYDYDLYQILWSHDSKRLGETAMLRKHNIITTKALKNPVFDDYESYNKFMKNFIRENIVYFL